MQETEKIIAELNETWEEKLRRTEAIRMERWVGWGGVGQRGMGQVVLLGHFVGALEFLGQPNSLNVQPDPGLPLGTPVPTMSACTEVGCSEKPTRIVMRAVVSPALQSMGQTMGFHPSAGPRGAWSFDRHFFLLLLQGSIAG